jgi:toxin ParE1/3/4
MPKPWRFHREAEREVTDAADWYEREREGLGAEFLDAVQAQVADLRRLPTIGSPVPLRRKGVALRRVWLARFPYALVFAELGDEFVIFAVAHGHRRPTYWRRRLP